MRTHAAEPHLNLIGDAYAPNLSDMTIGLREIVRRQDDLATATQQCLADERRYLPALPLRLLEGILDMTRVQTTGVPGVLVWPAVAVRGPLLQQHCRCDPDVDEARGVSVVSTVEHDDVRGLGVGAREAQREFIRLAA